MAAKRLKEAHFVHEAPGLDALEPHQHADVPDEMREQMRREFEEELEVTRFKEARPDMWLAASRIYKLIDLQAQSEDQSFPEGACFIHATTPNFTSFCVRQVLEIDFDTCTFTVEIYGDDELDAGIVVLPLEIGMWFGFPADHLQMKHKVRAFTSTRTIRRATDRHGTNY